MASNSFGKIFRITTWGESHGKAIGVVIDGCPAGINLSIEDINNALKLRAPGRNKYTSLRAEADQAEIYSGVFENTTTGAPISLIIDNKDHDSSKYESIKNILRPGHANFTYLKKYGIFDYRGGGRASARETACRVAAAAVAKKILDKYKICIYSYIKSISNIVAEINTDQDLNCKDIIYNSPIFCPDSKAEILMQDKLRTAIQTGDSLGGVIEFVIKNLPAGLGDPVYNKLEANLAHAMLSIPASKGFEIGDGFNSTFKTGSEHNDVFINTEQTLTNHAGGTLGGISTGMDLIARVAFKPTSSIKLPQSTVDLAGKPEEFILPEGSRHDPCVAIRAVPVVEAMAILVIADLILLDKTTKYAEL
ncbi:MAG: chorismate synthase [Gammaproteobacteria bacterium]|nr:chorismate synthase [Gammaproteobacteria bacterium]